MTYKESQNKLKEKYHEKFRKHHNKNENYFVHLLRQAWNEYDHHPAMNPYNRENGATPQDREELHAIMELIKLYQSRIELKQEQEVKIFNARM
jgi:hypothetical protein